MGNPQRAQNPSFELGPPTHFPANVSPPELKVGDTLADGCGGPNSDAWRKSLALCLLCGNTVCSCFWLRFFS
jgi:hypothetical protein